MRTARYSLTNPSPAAIVCDVEVYLDSQGGLSESALCIQANSISRQSAYDFIMPNELGTYHLRIKARGKEIPIEPIGAGEVTIASVAPIRFEYYNTGYNYPQKVFRDLWFAQIFTPLIAHKITSVKLEGARVGTPNIITASIRATDGGLPTGADLCSGTTDGNTLPPQPSEEWREITIGGADLQADTKYAIVVRVLEPVETGQFRWLLTISGTYDYYPRGYIAQSNDGGVSWTFVGGRDFMFEEWGCQI